MIRSRVGLRGRLWLLTTTAGVTTTAAPTTTSPPATTSSTTTPAPTYVAPTPTTNATRFDAVADQAMIAPGSAATGKLLPNGLWFGHTATIGGTTITLPSSGNAPVSYSVTPAAGEASLTVSNTAGLLNPYPPPVNVFASSNGTAQSLSIALNGRDMLTAQRDTVSGAPTGFPSSFTAGWGEVTFSISAIGGSTGALYVKLYDALSTGATSTVGTGTQLTSGAVQVYGAVSGASTVRVLLPASITWNYADFATDAAFTSPVRVAQTFRVGALVAMLSRSQEAGFAVYYADSTAFAPIETRVSTWVSGDYRYAYDAYSSQGAGWARNTNTTSAGQEFARILQSQLGVGVSFTGIAATGGGLDEFVAHDGTPCGAFTGTVAAGGINNKFRYVMVNSGGWDGVDSNYPTETFAEDQTRIVAAITKIPQMYPTCAVIRWCWGASGWFGSDGSRDLGYTRLTNVIRSLEPANSIAVGGESTLWNEFVGGHASQGARPDYARTAARMILAVEPAAMGGLGTTNRGPTLAASGSVVGRILRIPYTLHGGTTLTSVGATYTNPTVAYNTASPAELAALFSVYSGAGGRSGNGLAIKIDTATINTGLGTIDLALTGTSGVTYSDGSTGAMPSLFNCHYGADFGASAARLPDGRGASLCDNIVEYSIPYGRLARPALDIAVS